MLLHDNATTLRVLTCLILWLIYCSFRKSWYTKFPLGGKGIYSHPKVYYQLAFVEDFGRHLTLSFQWTAILRFTLYCRTVVPTEYHDLGSKRRYFTTVVCALYWQQGWSYSFGRRSRDLVHIKQDPSLPCPHGYIAFFPCSCSLCFKFQKMPNSFTEGLMVHNPDDINNAPPSTASVSVFPGDVPFVHLLMFPLFPIPKSPRSQDNEVYNWQNVWRHCFIGHGPPKYRPSCLVPNLHSPFVLYDDSCCWSCPSL